MMGLMKFGKSRVLMMVLFQAVDLPKFLKHSQVPVLWLSVKRLSPTLKLIELMNSFMYKVFVCSEKK